MHPDTPAGMLRGLPGSSSESLSTLNLTLFYLQEDRPHVFVMHRMLAVSQCQQVPGPALVEADQSTRAELGRRMGRQ